MGFTWILLLFFEQAWLGMLVLASFSTTKWRPIALAAALLCVDMVIKNQFMAPAHFSSTGLVINILNTIIAFGVLVVYRKKSPYFLMLVISIAEAISLLARMVIR